jgi:hypothetical protein
VVTAEPVRVSICHCFACQRRTGSPFSYQARFPAESVKINGRSKQFIRHADEDDEIRRSSFCPECGSTVFFTGGDSEDVVAIPVGAFADPSFPPPEISVWEERKHNWVVVPDGADHIY